MSHLYHYYTIVYTLEQKWYLYWYHLFIYLHLLILIHNKWLYINSSLSFINIYIYVLLKPKSSQSWYWSDHHHDHMKSLLVNWRIQETHEEAGYRKSKQIVEFVTLADNLLSWINCTQPLDFSNCVGNKKMILPKS